MGEACKVIEINDHLPLPLGAVIYGKVTLDMGENSVNYYDSANDIPKKTRYVQKDVICRVDEVYTPETVKDFSDSVDSRMDEKNSPKTAKYFLCKMQRFLNGGNDTIGEKGVKVERIDFPDRAQTLKLVGGSGWSTLDGGPDNALNRTPGLIGRTIEYCRSGLEKFFGI